MMKEPEHLIVFQGHTKYPNQPEYNYRMSTTAVTLDELLPDFDQFLRGMGFSYDGHLEIVNEEEE